MADLKEARVPDIGGYDDVPVIELLVAVGDTVKADQGLVTLESDKATMEVPAPFAGVIRELKAKVGDKLSEGSVVALIEAGEGEAKEADANVDATAAANTAAKTDAAEPEGRPDKAERAEAGAQAPVRASETGAKAEPAAVAAAPDKLAQRSMQANAAGVDPEAAPPRTPPIAFGADEVLPDKVPYASPAVRLFARELGVDLAQVTGSERGGRIGKEDVQAFVKSALAGGGRAATGGGGLDLLPWPKVDFAKFGPVETRELTRIQKLSGANLARNWAMIPHVTQHDDADITGLEALRESLNEENAKAIAKGGATKLTMLAFVMKAAVAALQKYPAFNASLDGDTLVLKQYFHIGFAADTPNGLVVPVVRDCDRKGVMQIAQETAELAAKARDGKLGPAQMQGGCFTISSLGGIGGTSFTPIINAPEVAILGVSRSAMRPVWNEDAAQFEPRLILPLSLSYDHRVIDGAAAARFTAYLAQLLGDLRRAML
jgi:pyruvate dehydrogenase E2 component (dihydrolipoamide acetyltransferase)